MSKWLVLLSFFLCLFSCSNMPNMEFDRLIIGNACDGENLMNNLSYQQITIDPQSEFAFLNYMAEEIGYPNLDLSSNETTLKAYVNFINQAPDIFALVQDQYKKGVLSEKLSQDLEFITNGKDRCCTVSCDCGTVHTLVFTMYDVGKIKGILTCRYFRGLSEGPYEEIKKLFDENKEDLPTELIELAPILENLWSEGESCDYDIENGICEVE